MREVSTSIVSLAAIGNFLRGGESADRVAAWIGDQQLGVLTAQQLSAAGLSKDVILRRCNRGTLHRVHQGVYRFGTTIMLPGARELAAILACGEAALLSHRSAAAMWGLTEPSTGPVDILVVGDSRRSHRHIRVHRASRLHSRDRRLKSGIALTAPARTLIDLAAEADGHELERALAEARVQRLVSDRELTEALDRAGSRSGVARMREILRSERESGYTRSEAERQMRRLVAQARLPAPRVNARIDGAEVDFYWPEHKLVVEVDGFKFHGHRGAFERDRRKDMTLVAAGYRVVRVTWRQLTEEPVAVAAMLASALTATG